jgi:hypothetical protein
MTTVTGKAPCFTCGKKKSGVRCEGCLQTFCFNHFTDHRQEFTKSLNEIEVNHESFRQTLTEQALNSQKHPIQVNLAEIANQLKQTREENNFNEIDIHQFKQQLIQLTEESTKSKNISIQDGSASLVNKISVIVSDGIQVY